MSSLSLKYKIIANACCTVIKPVTNECANTWRTSGQGDSSHGHLVACKCERRLHQRTLLHRVWLAYSFSPIVARISLCCLAFFCFHVRTIAPDCIGSTVHSRHHIQASIMIRSSLLSQQGNWRDVQNLLLSHYQSVLDFLAATVLSLSKANSAGLLSLRQKKRTSPSGFSFLATQALLVKLLVVQDIHGPALGQKYSV